MSEARESALIHPIQLRLLRLANNLVMAPMAGVSNLPFRLIARESGAALAFTETVSAKGLVVGGAKTWRLLRSSPREAPVAFQLFGSDAAILGEACRRLADQGSRWIDFNMGCPVPKFIKNRAGSALLRDLPRATSILREMRRAFSGTFSLKLRTGWDAHSIVAPEMARIAASEGVELISIHGRTRAQQYTGLADREVIQKVVEAVPQTPVLANGDIASAQDVFSMLRETGACGVMIGRGAMGNPWIFEQTLAEAEGRPLREPGPEQRLATLLRHAAMLEGYYEDARGYAANLKKYVAAYSKGLHGCAAFRQATLEAETAPAILELARRFFGEPRAAA